MVMEEEFDPRYAPDDLTLPLPWKGLIDGNGLLYYWNPESNAIQYEKPVSVTPSSPPPPPPPPPLPASVAFVTNLAPIYATHTMQTPIMQVGGMGSQQLILGQSLQVQVGYFAQHHGQSMPPQQQQQQNSRMVQIIQQNPSQVAQYAPQQNSLMTQSVQIIQRNPSQGAQYATQQNSLMTQTGLHQARQQMMQFQGQQMLNQLQIQPQMSPQAIHSQHFGQRMPQDHDSHIAPPQGHQFPTQNIHYMSYQQNIITPRQPNSQHMQPNTVSPGQPNPQQVQHNQKPSS
ncbi:DEAD-box ATP-dependent RNA helicase 40 [Vigna radiata var. radiata]|uniref:DEAD-box ATP-dependent RNA helicase 40 n=1 Tax=Vigna radiata var. radiata TaxID=3916 RepID=A0A1S3VJ54_VIGRR|nr:DEAD-box ATP-dependent RNA helicase 40 [Vigna radiata var. radiata]